MNVNNPRNRNDYYKHIKSYIWSKPYLIIIDPNYTENPKMDRYFVDYNGEYNLHTRFKDLNISSMNEIHGLYIDDDIKKKNLILVGKTL